MKPTVMLAAAGLILLAGLAIGWSAHARQLNRRQANWKDSVQVQRVRTEVALGQSRAARAEADSLRELASRAAQAASALDTVKAVALHNRKVAEAALQNARTAGDSLHTAIELIGALNNELAIQTDQAGRWRLAFQQEQAAAALLGARGDSLEVVVQQQDSLLTAGERVVGSSGCRVPLIGVKCPVVVVGYGVTGEVTGSAVAIHRGVSVTAGWKVF